MNIKGCVATTRDQYIKIACRLANDDTFLTNITNKISEKNIILFENINPIAGWDSFFKIKTEQYYAEKQIHNPSISSTNINNIPPITSSAINDIESNIDIITGYIHV